MDKVTRLLTNINLVIKALDDDPTENMPDFEGKDKIVGYVDDLEKRIAKLLRKQLKYYTKKLEGYVQKDVMDMQLLALLSFLENDLFPEDPFEEELSAELQAFFTLTVSELVSEIMQAIDKDVSFEVFSTRTTDWIERWSGDLANLMNVGSQEGLKGALTKGLEEGEGIPKIIDRLMDLPEFDRLRARRTAITEVLTANSVSQFEAYTQSPAVTKKKWKHSGGKRIKPRPHHVDLDGTEIDVDAYFDVGDETALYPRDTNLSAKERVMCHCVLGPVVDPEILGLSPEEKAEIRRQALENL
jgi:hypothetical protein